MLTRRRLLAMRLLGGGGVAPPATPSSLLTNLVAYWKLDEASGTRADSAGANTLADNATVTSTTGKISSAAQFVATNREYLSIADNAVLSITGSMTIAGWFKLSSRTANMCLVSKWHQGGAARSYRIYYVHADGTIEFRVSGDGTKSTTVTMPAPAVDEWHWICGWFDNDANTISIQMDDGEVRSATYNSGIHDNAAEFAIGRQQDGVYYDGLADEVGVWSRALTATERWRLYAADAGLAHPFGAEADADPYAITSYDLLTQSGASAYGACRAPHQRMCWYAAGRYWVLYVNYTDSKPYYTSSADGVTWATPTNVIPNPGLWLLLDARWTVAWDGTHIHYTRNIQAGGTPVHDGLYYRRGTPGTDGVITWDAVEQTVLATGNAVGDPSLAIGTDGHAWVGYGDGDTLTNDGNAAVIRNDATDGTWSTTAGFPVALTAGDDERFAVLTPLATGEMYAAVYQYDGDTPATGHKIAVDGTVTDEGNITAGNVEGNSGKQARVGRIEIAGDGTGLVHIAYQDDAYTVRYRSRAADGTLSAETELSGAVQQTATSPRISLNGSDVYVTWTGPGYASVRMRAYVGGSWEAETPLWFEALEADMEHVMPAEELGDGKLQVVVLTDDLVMRHRVVSVPTS